MIHNLLEKRFNGTGNLIYMATSTNNMPSIRSLTPYYQDSCFYAITDKTSSKIKQIEDNPNVAICGLFFNAKATATLIGPLKNNPEIASKLIDYCESWIKLGHVDVESENTCILKIQIQDGYIIDKDKRYEIHFS